MTDSDDLQDLVDGKDSKILAREIGRTQDKVDEMGDDIKGKIDEKMGELPCEEHEDRLGDLEEFEEGVESVWEERERQERQWYHSWDVGLEALALIVSIIAIIVSTLVAVGVIG